MKLNLFQKIKLAGSFFANINKMTPIDLYNEDLLKGSMRASLQRYNFKSPYNDIILEDILDSAISHAKGLGDQTHIEKVASVFAPVMDGIATKVALTGGLACLWELELKFFASKLKEIPVFEIAKDKVRLRTANVAQIAAPIANYYPFINCDLKYTAELRNNLFHGNFHQLKAEVEKRLRPEEIKDIESKIAVVHTKMKDPSGRVLMSNEVKDLDQARDLGMFLWFMSAGNSKLLDYVIKDITNSVRDIQILMELHAYSFRETEGFFDQLAKEGKRLTTVQENIFFKTRKHGLSEALREQYLTNLYSVLKLKE